jgi:hypothetical protein
MVTIGLFLLKEGNFSDLLFYFDAKDKSAIASQSDGDIIDRWCNRTAG